MPSIAFSLATIRPAQVGGAETYARGLLKAFGAMSPYTVRVIGSAELVQAYRQLAGPRVEVHGGRFALRSRGLKLLTFTVGSVAPLRLTAPTVSPIDAIHYPLTVPVPHVSAPHIVTLHDVRHHDAPQDFPRWERLYRSLAYDRPARQASLVITVSEHARARLIDVLGLDPARVRAIHHGIDHDLFNINATKAEDDRTLAAFKLPGRYLFYPANLWQHKNHKSLLHAFARSPDRTLGLVLTGLTYDLGGALSGLASQLGLGDRVKHLGYVSRRVLPALYRRAEGLIFPSRYEGFGAPPLEAMACGCPVAAGRSTAVAEVCADAALLFDLGDPAAMVEALDRLVHDDELRARLRSDGLNRASQFTWEAAATDHLEVYRAAVEQRPFGVPGIRSSADPG